MNRFARTFQITHILYVSIVILPFLMFHWMIPFLSNWTLGKDYQMFSIFSQMELMFSLKTGSFPLYVPGYAAGQSASALTTGQIFHPISHIAGLLPGYWTGKALELNTLLRLLSLGGAHLVLFAFLRRLKLDCLIAFILSVVAVYNLRTLDLFRYGSSIVGWTGHLFLCVAIGSYYVQPTKWKGPLIIICATYWLVCSGHPQATYYGLLGAGLFALIVPYFVIAMLPDRSLDKHHLLRFWLKSALWIGIGIILSMAYILPFYFDFVISNAGRIGRDYAWSDTYRDTLMGTVNNFFYPLRSDVHGVFGGSSLFIIAAILPVLKLFRIKIPAFVWLTWGLILLAFLHMQGARTPIHYIVWKYLPLASSFRISGRISMILPVLFMLVLAWVMRAEDFRLTFSGREVRVAPGTILSIISLLMIAVYLCLADSIASDTATFIAISIRQIPHWVELATLLCGAAALIAISIYGSLSRFRLLVGIFLSLLTCAQIMGLFQFGTWIERKKDTPSLSNMLTEKRERLGYGKLPGVGMCSNVVIQQARRSFLEPFLGKVYPSYVNAKDNEEAYDLMAEGRMPDQVIVEEYTSESGTYNESQISDKTHDRVELIYSSFNRLVFNVWASRSAFFGMAYPYTGHWRAWLNSHETHVYRANGASHAVRVPAGFSRLEFRYWSTAAFCGMMLSCATFALIGLVVGLCAMKKPLGVFVAAIALILGTYGFVSWYQSLYSGQNLNTIYSWSARPPAPLPNLAYGKRTQMSSNLYLNYPYLFSSGGAVDGNRTSVTASVTHKQRDPWWMVDLYRPEQIGSVVVYETPHGPVSSKQPLVVMLSNDKNEWIVTSASSSHESPLRVVLEGPVKARYVALKSSGYGHLAINEVEIYPPAQKHTTYLK